MAEMFVARSADLKEGQWKIISNGPDEIGVVRVNGALHAFRNVCPHQGGPVCEGMLIHKAEEIIGPDLTYRGMRFGGTLHIVCPWHGWEFNVETGHAAGDHRKGLRKYEVIERGEDIYVVL
jgi:nitrite reductase (NADH) small subunit